MRQQKTGSPLATAENPHSKWAPLFLRKQTHLCKPIPTGKLFREISLRRCRPIATLPHVNTEFDHSYWMRLALQEAEKGYRIDEVPVGAVIVLDNQVIGRGYNQTEKLKDPTAHAEILAITSACSAVGDWRLDGAALYCTLEPCSMCAGAAVLARIAKIVYGASDPKFGACGSIFNIPVDPRLNHRVELEGGVLGDDVADMMRRFFREVRHLKGEAHDSP